jgi:hypothetical protein
LVNLSSSFGLGGPVVIRVTRAAGESRSIPSSFLPIPLIAFLAASAALESYLLGAGVVGVSDEPVDVDCAADKVNGVGTGERVVELEKIPLIPLRRGGISSGVLMNETDFEVPLPVALTPLLTE